MDTLPVELLDKLMEYLSPKHLRKLRLMNSTCHKLATARCRALGTTARLTSPEKLMTFNMTFTASIDLPFNSFEFSRKLFWSETKRKTVTIDSFQEFGMKYGELARVYRLNAGSIPNTNWETVTDFHECQIECKMTALLKHAINLVDLTIYSEFELTTMGFLPQFPKLRTLHARYSDEKLANSIPDGQLMLIEDVIAKSPGLSHVTLEHHQALSPRFIQNLQSLSVKCHSAVAHISIQLSPSDQPELLEQLFQTKEPNLVRLDVHVVHYPVIPDFIFWNNLVAWTSFHRTNLRKLSFKYTQFSYDFHPVKLPSFPFLEELTIQRSVSIFVPFQMDQFPALKKLDLYTPLDASCRDTQLELFSACNLSNVTELKIFATEDNVDNFKIWNRILPNMKVLKLMGDGVAGAFRLGRIVDLTLDYEAFDGYGEYEVDGKWEVRPEWEVDWEWEVYTGGVPAADCIDILNLPVAVPEADGRDRDGDVPTEENRENGTRPYHLGDLKRLEKLRIQPTSTKALEAILYLTKTNQLHRLKLLSLSKDLYKTVFSNGNEEAIINQLLQYHDRIVFHKPTPGELDFLWDQENYDSDSDDSQDQGLL